MFPLTVNPTKLPDGVAESVHINIDPNAEKGQAIYNRLLEIHLQSLFCLSLTENLRQEKLSKIYRRDLVRCLNKLGVVSEKIIEGQRYNQYNCDLSSCYDCSKKMEKKIHDQLEESGANKQLRNTAFEMALFGTGIMKGTFCTRQRVP